MRNWPGLYLVSTLLFPRRSDPSAVVAAAGASYVNAIRVALGGPVASVSLVKPKRKWLERRKCHAPIVWPTITSDWISWFCPLDYRHPGLHADDNYWSGYHDVDIAFMRVQYDLLTRE